MEEKIDGWMDQMIRRKRKNGEGKEGESGEREIAGAVKMDSSLFVFLFLASERVTFAIVGVLQNQGHYDPRYNCHDSRSVN